MFDPTPAPQPVLTSHEGNKPRGKQRFDVQAGPQRRPPFQKADNRPQHLNKRPQRPQAPKPTGFCHDQLLKTFKGTQLLVTTMAGDTFTGTLIDSDRYVLILKVTGDVRQVIFKHAIETIALPQVQ